MTTTMMDMLASVTSANDGRAPMEEVLGRLDASLPGFARAMPTTTSADDDGSGETEYDEDEDAFGTTTESPIGSLSGTSIESGSDKRRRGLGGLNGVGARAWTWKEEEAFYTTFERTGGDRDACARVLSAPPFNRDKDSVRKFYQNSLRRIGNVLKTTFELSLDAKNAEEVVAAFRAYWEFREGETGPREDSMRFGRRLSGDKSLKVRFATALRMALRRVVARADWHREGDDERVERLARCAAGSVANLESNAVGQSGAAMATATTTAEADAAMKPTAACIMHEGKPRFVLQLFPLDEETSKAMHLHGYSPLMELTFRQKKSIPGLILHLSEKWVKASPSASHILQLHPYDAGGKSGLKPWNATFQNSTAEDVYSALGSPWCFRLRYAWADRKTVLKPKEKKSPPSAGKRRKSTSTTMTAALPLSVADGVAFDPIPGDVPVTTNKKSSSSRAALNMHGDLTLSDFNGNGFSNLFATTMDGHATRQPLGRVNSPSKPTPLRPGPMFSSPVKKGKPLAPSDASLLRVLDGIGVPDDGVDPLGGAGVDTLGGALGITDSLFAPGDSMFHGALFSGIGGENTKSNAVVRRKSVGNGPIDFSGMFS